MAQKRAKRDEMDWEDIKFLGSLAKQGTVRGAAKDLGVHHSTVSRRIEALEQAAGARIFDRVPEGYVLTEAGEHLAQSAKVIDEEVLRAQRLILGGDQAMAGRILVTMPEPVAVYAFAPRMPEFFDRYPNLEIEISSSMDMLDLGRRKADVAVRMNNNPPESLFGKRLFAYNNAIYCSREYLKGHDPVNRPEHAHWIGWEGTFESSPKWTKGTPFEASPVRGSFPSLEMQVAMARGGAGLAWLPCFIGDRDPQLVRACDMPPVPARDIWILTHSDLRRTTRIRTFMKFAESVIVENKPLFLG